MSTPVPEQICPRCGGTIDSGPAKICKKCLASALLDLGEEPPLEAEPVLRRLGDYELLEELARGGSGVVFRARQLSLDREVAVKVLHNSQAADTEVILRFRAEATTVAKLTHPNIVPVFEVGEVEGQNFLSMALIRGPSLAELTRAAPLSPIRAARLVQKIAEAVQHAHERGILHRDLKPGNVLVDEQDEPHVTDFGLARSFDRDASLTLTGQVLGTPQYMAPEQALGLAKIGPGADVYSLGALLFHLLTARPPFIGGSIPDQLRRVTEQEAVSPRWLNPEVPIDLATVCLKCLKKEPAQRYVGAGELASDLGRFLEGKPTSARPTGAFEQAWLWCRRKPALASALASAALIAVLGLLGVLWQWHQAEGARQRAIDSLWNSYLAQIQVRRTSGFMEQRTASLKALRAASAIRRSSELRDEAIAVLALDDLALTPLWRPHASPMAYSDWAADPDLEHIAVRDHPREAIKVWSLRDGQETELSFHRRNGRDLRFSSDGKWLAAHYFSGELVMWNWRQNEPRSLGSVGPVAEQLPLDFSHDSAILAVASGNEPVIRMFSVQTGAELPALVFTNQNWTPAFRFNPRRSQLALGVGNAFQLWDIDARRLLYEEQLPTRIFTLAWHPDGQRVAFACWRNPDIHVWDTVASTRRVLHGPTGSSVYLSFHPTQELLAARGTDGNTRLWDLSTDQQVLKTDQGLSMDFGRQGTRLAYDHETEGVGVWDLLSSQIYQRFRSPFSRSQPLGDVAFSPDGRSLAWGGMDALCWLNLQTGRMDARPTESINSLRFDPQGPALFTAGYQGVQQWPLRWVTNGAAVEMQLNPARTLLNPETRSGLVRWMDLSPQGAWLAAAGNEWAKVWPVSGETDGILFSNLSTVISAALSPDRRWLACGTEDFDCLVYAVAEGKLEHTLAAPSASVTFDPQGRWLITGSVKDYVLWEVNHWRAGRSWPRASSLRQSGVAAFSRDSSLLALAHSPTLIRLVKPDTGATLATLTPPNPLPIRALAFSPDQRRLAAASENGVVQVWDLWKLRAELRALNLDWP